MLGNGVVSLCLGALGRTYIFIHLVILIKNQVVLQRTADSGSSGIAAVGVFIIRINITDCESRRLGGMD